MRFRSKRVIILTIPAVLLIGFILIDGFYLAGQGIRMFMLRRGKVEVETLLTDPNIDRETRGFLELTTDIINFATDRLGLKASLNYTTFIATEKPHATYVVSAVRSDSLERYTKRYPVVGRVFYRGYYNEQGARRFAARLEGRGYDVLVRTVGAYSSLGIIDDPLYSYMRDYTEYRLAEMLIHELAHATIWLKDSNQVNEEIATFIGRQGAAEYIRTKYGADSADYLHISPSYRDRTRFLSFVRSIYNELEAAYREAESPEERLSIKADVLSRAKSDFLEQYGSLYETNLYSNLAQKEWNHAFLDIYIQYNQNLDVYYSVFTALNNDLTKIVHILKDLQITEGGDLKVALQSVLSGLPVSSSAPLTLQD